MDAGDQFQYFSSHPMHPAFFVPNPAFFPPILNPLTQMSLNPRSYLTPPNRNPLNLLTPRSERKDWSPAVVPHTEQIHPEVNFDADLRFNMGHIPAGRIDMFNVILYVSDSSRNCSTPTIQDRRLHLPILRPESVFGGRAV